MFRIIVDTVGLIKILDGTYEKGWPPNVYYYIRETELYGEHVVFSTYKRIKL